MKKIIDLKRAKLLKYDIRALTVVVDEMVKRGAKIWAWENIGDPIKQGHQVPEWIKAELQKAASVNANWGYSATEGAASAREFIVSEEAKKGVKLDKNDVVFASGLGHCINTLYQAMIGSGVRTLHPSPTYPAHSSSESFFANG